MFFLIVIYRKDQRKSIVCVAENVFLLIFVILYKKLKLQRKDKFVLLLM